MVKSITVVRRLWGLLLLLPCYWSIVVAAAVEMVKTLLLKESVETAVVPALLLV